MPTWLLLHGEARCNGKAACQLYAECFPHCQTPPHSLFVKVYQQALEMGKFTTRGADCSAPQRRCTPKYEEAVLHVMEEDATSIRNIAGRLNVDHQVPET